MPKLDAPGATLHYRSVGSGPPLILVHGSATDMSTWNGVVDELASDHRVIVYDRRGYGQSVHKPVRDHRIHARDLGLVLDRVAGEPAKVVGWSSGGNIALAAAVSDASRFSALTVVEAPFHGLRHADRTVLATAARMKFQQARGRRAEAAEVFFRFGSQLHSGGNSYDLGSDEIRHNLQANAGPVLAEWDLHPFGVMAEHVPLQAIVDLQLPITWMLGANSLPWLAKLQARVVSHRPDIHTVVIPGAGHLVHLDNPIEFIAAVRASASALPFMHERSRLSDSAFPLGDAGR